MKLIFIFSLAFCFQVSASSSAQKITLVAQNAPLTKVLKEIERQSGYSFWYKTQLLSNTSKVSVSIKGANLEDALTKVLSNQPVDFSIVDETVVLQAKKEPRIIAPAREILELIKGQVLGGDGKPLVGVTVIVKATKMGTTTDADGNFSLNATDTDVLVFSYIGFDTKEVLVGKQSTISVSLAESNTTLNEVAVVGYGQQSRKNLTSAVSTVKREELNNGAITDVGQLLQGKVPGLNITASGDPNKPAAVVMRGASTINSAQGPFYVIDGVPGADIATIAPDDIASIDVLKDAAATAIYGNRAANGVIMVTTKKGKAGTMQISYNGYVGIENISNKLDMMTGDQLRAFLEKNGVGFTPADDKGANTDWQSSIQKKTAVSTNHNLSFNGGSEHTTYAASLNYVKKDGILLNSDLTRVIGRLSIEQRALRDKLKFGFSVTNSHSNANDIPYRNTVLLQSTSYLPVSPIKNQDGSYFENFQNTNYYNPVAMINNSEMNTKANNLIGSFKTQVELPFGLTYNLDISYLNTNTLQGTYYNKYFTNNYNNMYDNPDPGLGFHSVQSFGKNGQANRSSYQNTSKILETYLTWNKEFGDHSINAVVGYSWQNNRVGQGFQVTTSNFPVDNVTYNNLALSNPYGTAGYQIGFGPDGVYQETQLISDFARFNYNYKSKYLLQGSVRRDGSSVFGSNNQWGYFPSVGAAWRISQESFMESQNLFSDLKLRASYGVTGNATGFNAYTAQFISGSLGTYYYNGALTGAYGPTKSENADLKWEKTATANVGLDFSILGSKVNGSFEVYDKNTTGMIYSYTVDPILVPSGSIVANGGSVNNKGIEFNVSAKIVDRTNLSWTSGVNLAHNKNEITSLTNPLFAGGDSVLLSRPEGGGQSGRSLQILKAGRPLGQFFSFEYAGKNEAGVSQFYAADGSLTTTPVVGKDYHYLGSAQPKLMMGWTNNVRYKNFDLNVFIRGVFGNKIFNATRADLFRPSTAQYSNILVDAANEPATDFNAYVYSSRFLESGSFVRFDNATLGYNFKKLGSFVKNLRVYTSVNNLFVITKYKGVDPEVNQGGIAPGVDYNNFYPKTRTFLFGLNISI
ncbi:SusC/RagA family TonB-linked outer membrane protein [Dyadobacter beijingensis]|uniref:SusC/RagA family TonB-linked outer membrane protein n=1 Tax=Dyadobacter beijingensis TaxID=365489 RepID=A0ABQ2ICN6_9BACT|nr:TonB-dependent receptor [Dyadobacter beijingensis]GGN07129.1 SusC/RagA family TonB-linked outer membrane protein [Dyadobacter beijingensis]